ncbi:MAG: diacylglycerol/lipid kinase family protein [Usitatibacter sp.]
MGTLTVVVNANAGRSWSEEDLAGLAKLFGDAGVEARILPARSGAELMELARTALLDGPPVIVAGGGDGTVSSVASLVQSTGTALGILPLGTLNHFARDVGIPVELDAAVRIIAAGRQIRVDVGRVNGKAFINNASLGIYPDIVRDRERQQRRLGRGKRWAMAWAILTALRRSPFLRVRLHVDAEVRNYRVPFVFIGNNVYVMEGFNIGTRESLREGRLSIYLTQRRGRLGLFALAFRALFGRLSQARDFEAATAQALDIESRHHYLPVATDGEVTLVKTPLHCEIKPGALRVIVP